MTDDIKLPFTDAQLRELVFRCFGERVSWGLSINAVNEFANAVTRAAVLADRARRVPLTDTAAPKNCRQVPPGNGLCDRCASGYPKLCRYIPAPKGGSDDQA